MKFSPKVYKNHLKFLSVEMLKIYVKTKCLHDLNYCNPLSRLLGVKFFYRIVSCHIHKIT